MSGIEIIVEGEAGLAGNDRHLRRVSKGAGLAAATGDHVVFLEAGDTLEPQALELLVEAAGLWRADIVQFAFTHERPGKKPRIYPREAATLQGLYDTSARREFLLRLDQPVWNKLYRRDLALRHADAFANDPRAMKSLLQNASHVGALGVPLLARHGDFHSAADVKIVSRRPAYTKALIRLLRPIRRAIIGVFYRRALKKPLRSDWVVLDAYWGDRIDCNPKAIFEELTRRGGYTCFWRLKNPGSVVPHPAPYRALKPGTRAYYEVVARAKFFVSNVNFEDDVVKREGSVHLETQHGTPLKKIGLGIGEKRPDEMDWEGFAERCRRWDYVISSNAFSTGMLRRDFPYGYKTLETGYPRNDIYFTAANDEVRAIRQRLGIPDGKKVMLFAPTYRDTLRDRGEADFDLGIDWRKVQEALGNEWIIAVRQHHLAGKVKARPPERALIIDLSSYPYSSEAALIADGLVTDYSSVMFDYACLNRPIIIYAPDFDDYCETRGVYFSIKDKAPGAFVETPEALYGVLSSGGFETGEAKARLARFRAEFCAWEDGQASKRVVDAVFGPVRATASPPSGR